MQPASDDSRGNNNLRRYGPLAVIVVLVLVVVGAVLFLGKDDSDNKASDDTKTTESTTKSSEPEIGAPTPTGKMPVTFQEAEKAGNVDDLTWSASCDEQTGYTKLPSAYGTPCVPKFEGDNGGATSQGVTADTIKIVRYIGDQSSDLTALLGAMGANDTQADRTKTMRDYFDIYSSTSELYGRKIQLVDFQGTGASDDVVASKADATQIIAEVKPFAVIGSPGLDRGTFAEELANHGIICVECGSGAPDKVVQKHAGYIWGSLPSVDQLLADLDHWVKGGGTASSDAKAVFAGNEAYRTLPRKVGVVHFEQDPPIYTDTDNAASFDVAREPYLLDFATMPTKATEVMAKYKQQGITTVVFLGDPIMPIYLTKAATAQEYFPEWIFTGTALTDTNVFGRQYDQKQMAHAFGISQLPVPMNQDLQETIRTYRWWTGDPEAIPPAAAQYNLLAPPTRFLVNGIHMAGPDLNPKTFARGVFRIPPAGGTPTSPRVSFGHWGYFKDADYWGIDDSTEIWWDGAYEAEDERGKVGLGVWRRSNDGKRFTNADPVEPNPFVKADSATVLTELPADATPPDYPPPPGSPAASR